MPRPDLLASAPPGVAQRGARVAGSAARGQHAAPSRAARLLPALLLVVPGVSIAGLKLMAVTAQPSTVVGLALSANSQLPPSPTGLSGQSVQSGLSGLDVPDSAAVAPPTFHDTLPPVRPRSAPRASRSVRVDPSWVLPLRGVLSSPFGPRWGGFHPGIDIAAPTGDPIRAAGAGTVVFATWDGGYGQVVRIDHPDGVRTVYAHLSRILVNEGDAVAAGQTIGLVGSTGFSTGPHLHFEVRLGGSAVDPIPWLNEHGVHLEARDRAS